MHDTYAEHFMLQKWIHFFPLFLIPPPPVGGEKQKGSPNPNPPPVGEKNKKGHLKTANTNSGRVNNPLGLLSGPKAHPWVPSDWLSPVLQQSSSSLPSASA